MLKIIHNLFWGIIYYINGCFESVFRLFKPNKPYKLIFYTVIGGGANVCSFIYQSVSLLSLCSIFGIIIIELIIRMTDVQHIMFGILIIFVLIILFIIIAMAMNAFFELFYYVMSKGESYVSVFKAQKIGNKFMLMFISLFSFCLSIAQYDKLESSILLFVCSIDVLLCILATNIYEAFILPQQVVKSVYDDWKFRYIFRKKY